MRAVDSSFRNTASRMIWWLARGQEGALHQAISLTRNRFTPPSTANERHAGLRRVPTPCVIRSEPSEGGRDPGGCILEWLQFRLNRAVMLRWTSMRGSPGLSPSLLRTVRKWVVELRCLDGIYLHDVSSLQLPETASFMHISINYLISQPPTTLHPTFTISHDLFDIPVSHPPISFCWELSASSQYIVRTSSCMACYLSSSPDSVSPFPSIEPSFLPSALTQQSR
jgi:hypothetical protein